MLILKFWPTYPPFCVRNFLGLGNPVWESCTPAYLRSLKILPIDFPWQKTYRANFIRHLDCFFRNYRHFKVFSKKFQQSISPFRVFAVLVSQTLKLVLQFLTYWDAVYGILLTTELRKIAWEKNFEFLPQKFFTSPQSQKKNFEKKIWLWKVLKKLGQKIKILFPFVFALFSCE